jgi:hypothetical protein
MALEAECAEMERKMTIDDSNASTNLVGISSVHQQFGNLEDQLDDTDEFLDDLNEEFSHRKVS